MTDFFERVRGMNRSMGYVEMGEIVRGMRQALQFLADFEVMEEFFEAGKAQLPDNFTVLEALKVHIDELKDRVARAGTGE